MYCLQPRSVQKTGLGGCKMNEPTHSSEEELKALIDGFFTFVEEEKKPVKKEAVKKGPTRKLKEPEYKPMSADKEAEAVKLAIEEMEAIRIFFLAFQNEVSDSPLYPYLYPHIKEFAEIAEKLEEVIQDDIDTDNLTGTGNTDYALLKKLRHRILDEVTKKYDKQGD